MSDPKAPLPSPQLKLVMTIAAGHRRWAFMLFLAFFVAPLISLGLARTFLYLPGTYLFFGLHLWLLVAIATLAAFSFLLFARKYFYKETPFVYVVNGEPKAVTNEELKNTTWRNRALAVLNGMKDFGFFGWIVWLTAVLAGIASAFKHTTVDQIKALGWMESYVETVNVAAGDLILASIIGAIVLFFVELFKTYQGAISKAEVAAINAEAASQSAMNAVTKTGTIIPVLEGQVEKTLDILTVTSNILGSETLSHNLAITLRQIADRTPALAQIQELSEMIVLRIKQINGEITHSCREERPGRRHDLFDLVSLAAIYTSYLKVETLSFEGEEADMGRRGCRLSTRYPHYALAVRSVVEALDKLDDPSKKRYKYYTVFNRRPINFFNPENPNVRNSLANVNWTIFFLEKFCRWHSDADIPYTRYFLSLEERDGNKGTIPPTLGDLEHDLDKRFILCNTKGGRVRPCLWGEAATSLTLRNAWSDLPDDQITVMIAAAEEILPPQGVRETLKAMPNIQALADPSYIILEADEKLLVEEAIVGFRNVVEFKALKEVLPSYHAQTSPPKKLKFKNAKIYDDFFSNGIPHDLFAVWDDEKMNSKTNTKGSWSLCIGTMVGESDPTAVEMICTTPERPLRDLHWDILETKLSQLFRRDPSPSVEPDGIKVEDLY